jgi:NAD(P)H dehydrogenase (quinone)
MRTLIVFAHPEAHSFNGALRDVASEALATRGHAVEISDLYAMRFGAAGGRADFLDAPGTEPFDYLAEQARAAGDRSFVPELEAEMQKVRRADLLLLQFPLWWFSVPAILKGWIDRVFAMGFAYDLRSTFERGPLRGKRAMLSVTTGSPEALFRLDGKLGSMDDILHPIHWGVLRFVGMDVLPPFVAYGVAHASPDDRAALLRSYRERMLSIDSARPLKVRAAPPSARLATTGVALPAGG